jgi:DNA-directed RNA polymerase subunit L
MQQQNGHKIITEKIALEKLRIQKIQDQEDHPLPEMMLEVLLRKDKVKFLVG